MDPNTFQQLSEEEKISLKNHLGFENDRLIILFVGGLYLTKGVHHLLSAFQQFAHLYPTTQLLVVGPINRFDQDYVEGIFNNIEKWGLTDRVTIIPRQVDNVDEYMKIADIFAFPSIREGMSNVLLEAMSTGLAIVAFDIPEIANTQIVNKREGLLVPPEDVNQFARDLLYLLNNDDIRSRLGIHARERVLRDFQIEMVDEQYVDLYRSVYKSNRNQIIS